MDTTTALSLIRDYRYKPGWDFRAEANDGPFPWMATGGNGVTVTTTFMAYDSTPWNTRDQERREMLAPRVTFDVSGCETPEDLAALFWSEVIEAIEIHEAREFFSSERPARMTDPRRADYHPHTGPGNVAYGNITRLVRAMKMRAHEAVVNRLFAPYPGR